MKVFGYWFCLFLLAAPLRADTIYSNLGPSGALYQPDTYSLVAGWFTDFTVSAPFSVPENTSGSLDVLLPIFALSTGIAPDGADSNNYPAFNLTLTSGRTVLWHAEALFPPWILNDGFTRFHACCGLYSVEIEGVQLQAGQPYLLTASPYTFDTTDAWYLNAQGQPGLEIQTPEPSPLFLLLPVFLTVLLIALLLRIVKRFTASLPETEIVTGTDDTTGEGTQGINSQAVGRPSRWWSGTSSRFSRSTPFAQTMRPNHSDRDVYNFGRSPKVERGSIRFPVATRE